MPVTQGRVRDNDPNPDNRVTFAPSFLPSYLRKTKAIEELIPRLYLRGISTGDFGDGLENSTPEFSKAQIKEMIDCQQNTYSWHFTFLNANQDAFSEVGEMGMASGGVANYAVDKVAAAYMATGAKVSRMRRQRSEGEEVTNEFTDQERKDMT